MEEKKYIQQKPKMSINEVHLRLCGLMVASIMPLNDVCDTYVTQAIHALRWFVPTAELPTDYGDMTDDEQLDCHKRWLAKHGWYRQNIKKWGKAVRSALDYNLKSATLRRTRKDMDEMEYEFHDQYEAQLKQYNDAVYWAVRNSMTRTGYSADKGDLLAKMMQACTMLAATCGMYEEGLDYYRQLCGADFAPSFCALYPKRAYNACRQLTTLVAERLYETGKPIDFSHDKQVITADRALFAQIRRKEHIEQAEAKAIAEYADKMDDMPESWKEKIKKINRQNGL